MVGFDSSDDACVYKASDDLAIINSIDFFPPIVDDPYMFGQIAAANSLSDIYAMGGTPKLAMNLLTFPEKLPIAAVEAILEGGNDKVNEAGAMTTGGHSINDKEPKYGLSVTGFAHPDDILSNSASEGDYLVITKKIGSGVLTSAEKVSLLSEAESKALSETMAELNRYAFGLLGHGAEMAKSGNVTLEIFAERVPLMDRVLDFASQGILPGGAHNNMTYLEKDVIDYSVGLKQARIDMLYDPQTSGGLLLAVKEPELERLQYQLGEKGCENAVIGRFKKRTSHYIEILNK